MVPSWKLAAATLVFGYAALALLAQKPQQLPTGKLITPVGTHAAVGSYPINMALSPDGKYVVVSTVGFREFLSVIRVSDGKVVSQLDFNAEPKGVLRDGLYYGLAFYGNELYAPRGAQDRITRFTLTGEGKLVSAGSDLSVPKPTGQKIANHPAGLAFGVVSRMLFAPPSRRRPPVC